MSINPSRKSKSKYTLFLLVFAFAYGQVMAKENSGQGLNTDSNSILGIQYNPETNELEYGHRYGLQLSNRNLIADDNKFLIGECRVGLSEYMLNQSVLDKLNLSMQNIACVNVNKSSSCESINTCVESQQAEMNNVFLDRGMSEALASSFMEIKLKNSYADIIAFDALALFAKDIYNIQYPAEIDVDVRKNCYYGLEIKKNSDSCDHKKLNTELEKFINKCAKGRNCELGLAPTTKKTLDEFSKEKQNISSSSFSMDYLFDQRNQLAEHYKNSKDNVAKNLYSNISRPEFQTISLEAKIKRLENIFQDDAVFSFLAVDAKSNSFKLKDNPRIAKLLNSKPKSETEFFKELEDFRAQEITIIMQTDKLAKGKECTVRENITTICAKAKAISLGGAVKDVDLKYRSFSLSAFEKEQAADSLINLHSRHMQGDEKEKFVQFGKLFFQSKICKVTDPFHSTGVNKAGNYDVLNDNQILRDVYSASNSSGSNLSDWGAEGEYGTGGLDITRIGNDSDHGNSLGNTHKSDAGLADFAKDYATDSKGGSDFSPANSFNAHTTTPTYIPSVTRASDTKSNNQSFDTQAAQTSVQEPAAGWTKNPNAISPGTSEELKAAKEQLAKSQQEMKALKDQMEKDKLANLETELAKKQKELDKLSAKVSELEKDKERDEAASVKIAKASKVSPTTTSSMGSLGSGNSISKMDAPVAKFDNKVSPSSSTQAQNSARTSESSRSPAAILSSTSSETRAAISPNTPVMKIDGMSNKDITDSIKKKINELKGGSFYIEENGVIKEIVVETKDGKVVLDANGNPVYKEIEIGKAGDKLLALPVDKTKGPKVKTAADLKKLDENAVKTNNNRGAFYQNLIKETKKIIKTEEKK